MGRLVIVPTPIGNLKDITLRALEVLKEADIILAEDTRTTSKLLSAYDFQTPLRAFHLKNEHRVLEQCTNLIASNNIVALVSDAGTPGISDPGYLLIREVIKRGFQVECLPGATALIPALVVSGIPCDRFYFEGFLPPKKGRVKRIESWKELERTIVLYESPHRINKLLSQLVDSGFSENQIVICRELSKMYEELIRGTVVEVQTKLAEREKVKGEIVVVLDPTTQKDV